MTVFVATFSYDASAQTMADLRPQRYEYFADLEKRGVLLASGQLLDGPFGDGMLCLEARNEEEARAVLADDPFATQGCIARVDLAAWRPTTGAWVNG